MTSNGVSMLFCTQIKALHQYDCLRANKATSAWGLEARVPFLDKEFINVAMSIDPEWKMVRNSFHLDACVCVRNISFTATMKICFNFRLNQKKNELKSGFLGGLLMITIIPICLRFELMT